MTRARTELRARVTPVRPLAGSPGWPATAPGHGRVPGSGAGRPRRRSRGVAGRRVRPGGCSEEKIERGAFGQYAISLLLARPGDDPGAGVTAAGAAVMHRRTDQCGHSCCAPVPGQAGAHLRHAAAISLRRAGSASSLTARSVTSSIVSPSRTSQPVLPSQMASRRPGTSKATVGTPSAAASSTHRPQPSPWEVFRCSSEPATSSCLRASGTKPCSRSEPPRPRARRGGQGRFGGAAPDHVDGEPAARQPPRHGQQQFGALVRDQAAHPGHRPAGSRGAWRAWPRGAVRDQVDVAGPAQPFAHRGDRGRGHRHAGVPPVGQPGGRSFQQPARPRHPAREVHAELVGVHVVDHAEHRHPAGQHARGEERDPVLAVEHGVKGPAVGQQPAEHARVHGEAAAHPGHRDPVVAAAPRLPGRPRGQEDHPRTPAGQAPAESPRRTVRHRRRRGARGRASWRSRSAGRSGWSRGATDSWRAVGRGRCGCRGARGPPGVREPTGAPGSLTPA